YCWYQIPKFIEHFGPLKVQAFARNRRYKLYLTGEYHDIKHDIMEKNPLKSVGLSAEAACVKEELQSVIDKYQTLSNRKVKND
ncbi:MAG: hypothetical protein KAT00_15300, partial [Planctomycetes bacterium]|nr:hypothetical protein [Planctomycetota bacterium]